MVKIVGLGDFFSEGLLNGRSDAYLCDKVCQILHSAYIRVGTLETAMGADGPTFVERNDNWKINGSNYATVW